MFVWPTGEPLPFTADSGRSRGAVHSLSLQTTKDTQTWTNVWFCSVLSCSVRYCSVEGLATVAQLKISTACPASTKEPLWVNDHVRRISRACRHAGSKWKASKLQSNVSDFEVLLGVSQHFKTRKWKYFSCYCCTAVQDYKLSCLLPYIFLLFLL